MNLLNISNEFQQNLITFFNNEKVIEILYTEQYGEDDYKKNEKDYKEQYKKIMDNTVFIPYITLDHLETFLDSIFNEVSYNYIRQNYEDYDEELDFLEKNSDYINKIIQTLGNIKSDNVYNEFVNKFGDELGLKYIEQRYYNNDYKFLLSVTNMQKNLESINEKSKEFGKKYLEQEYGEEVKLLKELQIEKKKIIKNYSSFMLDELKQFYPKLKQDEYDKILKKCKNESFEKNVEKIQELLSKNTNKKGFFQKSKQKKIDKCIKKYKKLADDKILMETSSYRKHIADIPDGKHYPNTILDNLRLNYPRTVQKINKNSNRNIIYVYLPVLTYTSKAEYLLDGLHEIGHIAKMIINKNKYRSGLYSKEITKNDGLYDTKDSLFGKVVHFLKWSSAITHQRIIYKKQNNLENTPSFKSILQIIKSKANANLRKIWGKQNNLKPIIHRPFFRNVAQSSLRFKTSSKTGISKRKKSYQSFYGYKYSEETIHDNTIHDAADKIINSDLINLLEQPYKKSTFSKKLNCPYEYFDAATDKFMSHFKTDIQNINNGQLSVKKFERKVGKTNFALYSHAAYACTTDKYENRKIYTDLGMNLVDKMVANSERKNAILEKTKNLPLTKILSIGEHLQKKLEHKKQNNIDNSLIR